jgi:HD-like signal output (HDOD) protein
MPALAPLLDYVNRQRALDVPMLPEVASRVIQLTQHRDTGARELAALIQSDPALAGHVMRIANSAAYCPTTSLVSLQQAIARLGMDLITEIALAASISTRMFNTPGFTREVTDVWRHALATALWAREISRHCRLNMEATFLCGLLHSIGWPVALQTLLDGVEHLELACDRNTLLQLATLLMRPVGLSVLEHWNMPAIIIETVRYRDDYRPAPSGPRQTLLVNAAAALATHMLHPEELPLATLLQRQVLVDLNLYPDEVQTLLARTPKLRQTLEAMRA